MGRAGWTRGGHIEKMTVSKTQSVWSNLKTVHGVSNAPPSAFILIFVHLPRAPALGLA